MKISEFLRRFDAYPKTLEDFSISTISGATVTLISSTVIIVLICLEFYAYLIPNLTEELFVDTTRGHKLRINIDITINNIGCNYLSLDAMDHSGEEHLQIEHNIFKTRLDLNGYKINEDNPIKEVVATAAPISKINSTTSSGEKCLSCYGAEQNSTHCCNTCEDVMDAYRIKKWSVQVEKIEQCKNDLNKYKKTANTNAFKEGCKISGFLEVSRVSGSFHIAPGTSFSINQFHIHDFQYTDVKLSHTINHLSFGEKIEFANTHPLDGLHVEDTKTQMYNYFIKIVPTMFVKRDGLAINTNQFSVTRHEKHLTGHGERGMPGLFFSYELSPLMVKYTERERSFGHFATNCCSIIGGVFTVAGIIVTFLHNSIEVIQRKLEIGKLS